MKYCYRLLTIVLLALVLTPLAWSQVGAEQEEHESPLERMKWFYEQRSFPFDTLKHGYLLNAFAQSRSLSKNRTPYQASNLSWLAVGPAPAGTNSGRIPAIAVHPSNGDIVYV